MNRAAGTIFFCLVLGLTSVFGADAVSLDGKWRFALDAKDAGPAERWFERKLGDQIMLPGVLQAQGFGNEISTETPWVLSLYDKNWFLREDYKDHIRPGAVRVPFVSQPPRHYLGAAWYQTDIEVPADWSGGDVSLLMERPRWESTVWINGVKIGSNRSLVAEHEYNLGALPAGKHQLTVRVDNRMLMDYRPDAHSVSDSLGMSWNGIVGKIELRKKPLISIDDAQIFADLAAKTATVKIKIANKTGESGKGQITANDQVFDIEWTKDGGSAEIKVSFPDAKEWNEFTPNLSKLRLGLTAGRFRDSREISFGFARIAANRNKFQLNGRTIYLRGTHHGGDFPLTGYPPTDVEYWRKLFAINKQWGINHVRFHSFCPPKAAFEAADEIGIYLQPEPGMWNVVSPGTPMEKMLYEETERMIKAYGNHPSFVLLSPSNEPKGRWKEAFDKWIAHYRAADPRRLYTNGTGHTEREVPGLDQGTDFLVMQRIGPKMLRGNSAWFGKDYGKSLEGINIPVASHELGQWVAYPDFDVIKKFNGYLRPGNYEIFRDSLAKKGLLHRNKDFAHSSGKFQLECYKEEIEANLRTPGMYGFQLLDLHDYIGQGTALVGLLDPFWEEKGYVTAKEFTRFNNETVPLARLFKRTFRADEQFDVDVEIAHFGEKPIKNAVAYWKIVDQKGTVVKSGKLSESTANETKLQTSATGFDIPVGKNVSLGKISTNLGFVTESSVQAAAQLKLIVGIKGTNVENDWDFWVYPAKLKPAEPKNITITHSWDEAEAKLKTGGKVLYIPRKADLDWTSPPLDTVPVFWNRLMNPAWGRMLGLWIDKKHPAIRAFPTDSHNGWQWTELVRGSRVINLDKLPKNLQPIVQPIDDWNRNYKLGMIFEAKVGKGRLLVSTADLENDLNDRIVARQLRQSLLSYMESAAFNPKTVVTADNFREVLFPTRIMQRLGAVSEVKEQTAAIDGDPNTFWLVGDQKTERKVQDLIVRFNDAAPFNGLVYMPRQNHRDHEGDVREYAVSISDDGKTWTPVSRGELVSTFDPQRVNFSQTVKAKYLKFSALSGFGSDKTTAIAELAIIYVGPKLPDDKNDLEYQRVRSASTDIDEGVNADDKKPKKP
jgi:beta-galactosidase